MPETIKLSQLGFGCASIMGKVGRREAMRSMAEAFDSGVTHFDTARSYGFGRAERVVGDFIRGKRGEVTITSKFGVVEPDLNLGQRFLIPVARALSSPFPQLKSRLRKRAGDLLAVHRFDKVYALACLHKSLRELRSECIDVYLLHEPDLSAIAATDELTAFLEANVAAGKIRRWGLAYRLPEDHQWAQRMPAQLVQFEGNFSTQSICGPILADRRQRIVTRPFAGGSMNDADLHLVLKKPETASILRDLGASYSDVSLCLALAMAGSNGSVVCSMFSSSHIRSNVRAINHLSKDGTMARLVRSLLEPVSGGQRAGAHGDSLPRDLAI